MWVWYHVSLPQSPISFCVVLEADNNSALVQVMAWCHLATSHYLSQSRPRSMMPLSHNEIMYIYLWCFCCSYFVIKKMTAWYMIPVLMRYLLCLYQTKPADIMKAKWHIYPSVSYSTIGSDNGLSPGRRQAIIWTTEGILSIGPSGTNFGENSIKIHTFSFKKMHLKISSAKWRPCCLGLNVLRNLTENIQYNGLVQKWCNSIANTLQLSLFCIKLSTWTL